MNKKKSYIFFSLLILSFFTALYLTSLAGKGLEQVIINYATVETERIANVILNDVRYAPDMDFENQKVRRLFLLNKDRDKIAKLEGLKELCLMGYEWSPFRLVEPDDKYKGIERMVKMLGGDVKDIVVFGDGINDIKMFQKAPFKIAMANACDELKELADFITHDSDEDGIEFALKHFGWIK